MTFPRHSPTPRRGGFTVMEMLAVLTLVSLLGTLVVQGLGFFAARYEAVKRSHRDVDSFALWQHWFAATVNGIVPVGVRERGFRGDATTFSGTSLQPLAGEGGVPAVVRWTVAEGGAAVVYQEEGLAAPPGQPIAWRLPLAREGAHSFSYADRQGRWHDAWPTDEAPLQWTPTLVRLGTNTGGETRTVWVARVEAASYPLLNEALLRAVD